MKTSRAAIGTFLLLSWAQLVLGCVLIFGCSTVLGPRAVAQDTASNTAARKLKMKVVPDYPAIARQLKLKGKVKIVAAVSADGQVISTNVVGGHPVLASAAVDAIKRWRFEPSPKDTTEIIEIDLAGRN